MGILYVVIALSLIVNEELLRRSLIKNIRSRLELIQFPVIQDIHKAIISK